MGIPRRASLPPIEYPVERFLAPPPEPPPVEEGQPPLPAPPDPSAEYRAILRAENARLLIHRASGREVAQWRRALLDAQARKAAADAKWREREGVREGEDPDSEQIMEALYLEIFGKAFRGLTGFEDAETPEQAMEALLDFLPALTPLEVWAAVMTTQEPPRPES